MAERPIIMNAASVRAILDGRKTQTRRVIKANPDHLDVRGKYIIKFDGLNWHDWIPTSYSPYGQPGDHLWVRETWRIGAWREDGRMAIDYKASPELTNTPWVRIPEDKDPDGELFERYWTGICDELESKKVYPEVSGEYYWEPGKAPLRRRSPIHMPRWASRITLEITGVRVERVQEITHADALAEGMSDRDEGGDLVGGSYAITNFVRLWDALNQRRGYGWNMNPWIWCITFRRIEP